LPSEVIVAVSFANPKKLRSIPAKRYPIKTGCFKYLATTPKRAATTKSNASSGRYMLYLA